MFLQYCAAQYCTAIESSLARLEARVKLYTRSVLPSTHLNFRCLQSLNFWNKMYSWNYLLRVALSCTTIYNCVALHCPSCTTLHWTVRLDYTTLPFTALQYTTLHYPALHCTALYYTVLHYTAMLWKVEQLLYNCHS